MTDRARSVKLVRGSGSAPVPFPGVCTDVQSARRRAQSVAAAWSLD